MYFLCITLSGETKREEELRLNAKECGVGVGGNRHHRRCCKPLWRRGMQMDMQGREGEGDGSDRVVVNRARPEWIMLGSLLFAT